MAGVRSWRTVPSRVLGLAILGLCAQIAWHAWRPGPDARAAALPAAPASAVLDLVALGEPVSLARLLMLWLQSFDNQPGLSIPFRQLDYARVEDWLDQILRLDPRGQYPLLAASRLYAEIPVEPKQRRMLDFVYRRFPGDPDRRWPWLAHGAILAKHRLHDLPLALTYAEAIAEHATGPDVPFWARDMRLAILEDMGELEAARLLVGGMLADGRIDDPRELRFLERKLEELSEEASVQEGGEGMKRGQSTDEISTLRREVDAD